MDIRALSKKQLAGQRLMVGFDGPDFSDDVKYLIDWGDGTNTGWIGPYNPEETITQSHSWTEQGNFTIKAKAKDEFDSESEWTTLPITMPKNRQSINPAFLLLFSVPVKHIALRQYSNSQPSNIFSDNLPLLPSEVVEVLLLLLLV